MPRSWTGADSCACDLQCAPSVRLPRIGRRRQFRRGGAMAGSNRRDLGRVFDEVPQLYDRVRPGYPDELFADFGAITGLDERSSVLEVGCGTGQATRSLAALGCSVTAIEPGADMAAVARQRLATFGNVNVETSTFEEWDDRGRRFHVLVAASAWHWVDPSIGWPRAHDVLHPGGWMACSATSLSAGRASRRCTPRPPICTSGSPPGTPVGVIRHSRTRCAPPTRVGDWSRIPAACSAPRPCAGTRPFSGSTGTALPISFARRRCTGGSIARSVSPCSAPSPSASARGWAIEHHAVT
jgi:SAM-dependent methyltransferase